MAPTTLTQTADSLGALAHASATTQEPHPARETGPGAELPSKQEGRTRADAPRRDAVSADGLAALLDRVDELLRDVPGLIQRLGRSSDLGSVAKAMILTIAAGAGAFGAAMGSFRGGRQVLYAAVKLPAVMLLTLAICAPALSAVNRALSRPADARRDLALLLAALGRSSLVLAAVAPVVLLAVRLQAGYHEVVLLVVGSCAVAGALGLALFLRGLADRSRKAMLSAAAVVLAVLGLVGSQLSWTLRPYLVRPRSPEIVFVRSLEGSFLDAVARTLRSARGFYERDQAPLPGESLRTRDVDTPDHEWEPRPERRGRGAGQEEPAARHESRAQQLPFGSTRLDDEELAP